MSPALLEVRDLSVVFGHNPKPAVEGASFSLDKGETLAIVGESGSGKTVTALSILQLLPYPLARHPSGSIRFAGEELLGAARARLRQVRGNRIAMVFQEPMTSLNPLLRAGYQVAEVLMEHVGLGRAEAMSQAVTLLDQVGIADAPRRAEAYPHQLSGGMRQRVMIAMALACKPKLLIADEPTTALDVTIQAQILALLRDLRDRTGSAILLITHDLGVIAETADRVLVMYAGEIVEEAPVERLFAAPAHPYTKALLSAIPLPDPVVQRARQPIVLQGDLPSPANPPSGCPFRTRCPIAQAICATDPPALLSHAADHRVACHFA
jgi:peptide/nickel transport system ATP-binding protein